MAEQTETLQERLRDIAGWLGDWDQDGDSEELRRAADTLDELLEALKQARGALHVAIRANVDLPDFDPSETMILKLVDAAIAKAEGQP